MSAPLWIIAVCAVLWTGRMIVTEFFSWAALHYRFQTRPRWLEWVASKLA